MGEAPRSGNGQHAQRLSKRLREPKIKEFTVCRTHLGRVLLSQVVDDLERPHLRASYSTPQSMQPGGTGERRWEKRRPVRRLL